MSRVLLLYALIHIGIETQYILLCNSSQESDYYWRPYNGEIPGDALEGGTSLGITIYIGQIIIPNTFGLIPAIIYPGVKNATGATANELQSSSNIQILCTKNKQNFKWIQNQLLNSTNLNHLIIGGVNDNEIVHIGRVYFDNNIIFGTVYQYNVHHYGLYILENGGVKHYTSYEVLSYMPEPDYYWRPYRGRIPEDAIPGGNVFGKTTYIGQIPIPNTPGLIPAIIIPGQKAALGTFHKPFRSDKYVKILCSGQKDNFIWLNASTTSFPEPSNLVVGGYETNVIVYIGRVHLKNNIVIGKAFDNNHFYKGLIVPTGTSELGFGSYEVLSYNNNIL